MERPKQQSKERVQRPDEIEPRRVAAPFSASDLPINDEGRIYHLQAEPGQIASDILLVGDPGRAEFIGANFLRDLEFEHEHRGLVTITGTAEITGEQATIISPVRTTVTTSGMGTPSLEIVVNELVALNEIDFETRTRKPDFPRLHIIRVGSSGGLQASTSLGTPIITSYAIGLDNTGLFYEVAYPDEICERLERELGLALREAMSRKSRFFGKMHPYVSRAEPALVEALLMAARRLGVAAKAGLTVSAPGFFAPQGRDIARAKPSVPELDRILAEFDPGLEGQRVENMEMETSFLVHFLGGIGYWAGAICPAIANRRQDTFSADYQAAMKKAIQVALLALASLRSRDAEVRMR
ncbi:MAG TPA: nucleoside phosphorylase [Anaerolineales bacterium]|nr:nucleoside phosphorylase [Anaerolineales bacterium]